MQRTSTRSPTKPRVAVWTGPAPLSIFLRNLKLLRLDTRSDWPDITLEVLSGSQNNLRRRIQAVEWSLYQLFLIWDKNEALTKFQPFFPPLEPLQSVNLRAAFFRALTDLKKNGVLGRETILRKTMLDDCKGDRFEEVLASFSTAILRKVCLATPIGSRAFDLALAQQLLPSDQEKLLPLVLAYHSSIGSIIEERKNLGQFYRSFNQHLHGKARQLTSRTPGTPEHAYGTDTVENIRDRITSIWYGDREWAEAILEAGVQVDLDPLLEVEFSMLRNLAKERNLDTFKSRKSSDLLVDLDQRIAQQKSRLQKWMHYEQSLAEERSDTNSYSSRKSHTLTFRNHQTINLASLSQPSEIDTKISAQDTEYESLLSDLKESFVGFRGPTHDTRKPKNPAQTPNAPDLNPHLNAFNGSKRGRTLPESNVNNPLVNIAPPHTNVNTSTSVRDEVSLDALRGGVGYPVPVSAQTRPNASTREIYEPSTLLERTRKSMSLLSVVEPQSREPVPSRKSSRSSQTFPVNQFEPPRRKVCGAIQRSGATTPRDELFNEDAEYASVFKSRPKIATSPINSPAVHVPVTEPNFVSGESLNLDCDEEYSYLDHAESSPSVRRRTMYM